MSAFISIFSQFVLVGIIVLLGREADSRNRTSRLFFTLTVLMIVLSCQHQEPVTTGDLIVVVTGENGTPLQGVKLGIKTLDYKYSTDSEGAFLFKDLDEGFVRLYAHMDGYEDGTILAKVVAGTTSRCDFPLKKIADYLRLAEGYTDVIDTFLTKGRAGVSVESNTTWTVEGDPSELILLTREGNGSGSITFEWDFPESLQMGDTLSRSFLVKGAGETMEIKLVLHVPIRIIGIEGREVNQVEHPEGGADGQVAFNRRVRYVNLLGFWEDVHLWATDKEETTYSFHLSGLQPELNFIGIKAEGGNGDGVVFRQDSIAFRLCEKREVMVGFITHTWLSADEEWMWASTRNPNGICKIDTRTLDVVKHFDLPFSPGDLAYNYANGRLYVIDLDKGRVAVLDADDGHLVKTIRVTDNPFEDTEPVTAPHRILFADNGYGIMTLYDSNSERYCWRIVDSRDNDNISFHSDCISHFADGIDAFRYDVVDNWEIRELQLDQTRTRIVGGPPRERRYLHVFNSLDNTHSTILTPYSLLHFDASREKDNLLLWMLAGITVLNLKEGTYTPVYHIGGYYDVVGDFCYGSSLDARATYIFSYDKTLIIDNTASAPVFLGSGKESGFNRLVAFRSGDRVLLIRNAFASGSELVVFDTNRFY